MKKSGKILSFVLIIFLFLNIISLFPVSGQEITQEVSSFMSNFGEFIKAIFTPIIGGSNLSGEAITSKILVFFLIFFILLAISKSLPYTQNHNFIAISISVIISLLSIRFFLTNELIELTMLPYGAFGIALTCILPILMIIYAINKVGFNRQARRLGYILLALIYISLAIWRSDQLPKTEILGMQFNLAWMYGIAVILLMISFFFDGTWSRMARLGRIQKSADKGLREEVNILRGKLSNLGTALASETDPAKQSELMSQMENVRTRIEQVSKEVDKAI